MKIRRYQEKGFEFLELSNEAGLVLTLSSVGAGIASIIYDGKSMTHAPLHKEEYISDAGNFYGKTIGPVAGRVEKGIYEIDGKQYRFPVAKNGNTLHSDSLNYAHRLFKISSLEENIEETVVTFIYRQEADEAFPGNVDVEVAYSLKEKQASFDMVIKATPDHKVPLNLTNHVYFNLGGDEDILDYEMEIPASKIAHYDDKLIVDGLVEVDEHNSFKKKHKIGDHIAFYADGALGGYDHGFVFDGLEEGSHQLVVENASYRLHYVTSAEAVQIYTVNFPQRHKLCTFGKEESRYCALTLEPVKAPLGIEHMMVDKGESFFQKTTFAFSKKEK